MIQFLPKSKFSVPCLFCENRLMHIKELDFRSPFYETLDTRKTFISNLRKSISHIFIPCDKKTTQKNLIIAVVLSDLNEKGISCELL